jgi:hypothetical protein
MAGKMEFAPGEGGVFVFATLFSQVQWCIRPHVCHSVWLNLCQIEGTRTEYTCRVPDLAVSDCCSTSYDTNLHKAVTQNVFSYTGLKIPSKISLIQRKTSKNSRKHQGIKFAAHTSAKTSSSLRVCVYMGVWVCVCVYVCLSRGGGRWGCGDGRKGHLNEKMLWSFRRYTAWKVRK